MNVIKNGSEDPIGSASAFAADGNVKLDTMVMVVLSLSLQIFSLGNTLNTRCTANIAKDF